MSKLDILAEEILIKVAGKRTMCKAVLLSDKGGHVVSYLVDGVEVKSQPLYRSPFKDKVKELKEQKAEQAPKQEPEQEPSELMETLRKTYEAMGVTNQQIASQYGIPLATLTAWFDNAPPEDYVINLLLRCLAVDFSTESALSEQEPVTKPTYTFTDEYGKPLKPKLEELVRLEFEAGKVQQQPEKQEQNFYGDLVNTKSKGKGKLYQCTETDLDSEIPFGFMFRAINKEV